MKRVRAVAVIMTVIILMNIFFSGLFIVEHTHHHCTGEDCPVCIELKIAAHTVSGLRTVIPAVILYMAFLYVSSINIHSLVKEHLTKLTLVGLKVELDD